MTADRTPSSGARTTPAPEAFRTFTIAYATSGVAYASDIRSASRIVPTWVHVAPLSSERASTTPSVTLPVIATTTDPASGNATRVPKPVGSRVNDGSVTSVYVVPSSSDT